MLRRLRTGAAALGAGMVAAGRAGGAVLRAAGAALAQAAVGALRAVAAALRAGGAALWAGLLALGAAMRWLGAGMLQLGAGAWRRGSQLLRQPRRLLKLVLLATVVLGVLGGIFSRLVARSADGLVFSPVEVPARDVALVFGAGVFPDGSLSSPLADRVRVAVELYRLGKVKKLLMSGDNSRRTYDESTAMKAFAVRSGVPEGAVALDYAGFHTYDSCYRARAVFLVRSAILVTQRFHLARALFTCRGVGVDALGVAADRQTYSRRTWYSLREQVARARAYVQVRITHPKPHFLGPQIPIL